MALATAQSVQLIDMDTGEGDCVTILGSIRDILSSSRPMERNCWSPRLVSTPCLNLIPRVEKSFGNGSLGTMALTDQSWVTMLFVRKPDAKRWLPWVTRCCWWTILKSIRSASLPGKNPHILTALVTTRMERFLSPCFIKARVCDRRTGEAKEVISGLLVPTSSRGAKTEDISSPTPRGAS